MGAPAQRARSAFPARFALVLGLALSLAAGWSTRRAAAAPPPPASARMRSPEIELPAGLALRAGQSYEIRWSVPDGGVEELEILLSIDGGRHFPLRVSPEVDPRAGRYRWRVPNLSSAEARLRIRYHRDGRELDGEPTPAFALVAASGGATGERGSDVSAAESEAETEAADSPEAGSVPFHEGTWWAGPRALDLPGARDRLAPPENRLTAPADPPVADAPAAAGSGAARERRAPMRPAISACVAISAPSVTPSRYFPLRN